MSNIKREAKKRATPLNTETTDTSSSTYNHQNPKKTKTNKKQLKLKLGNGKLVSFVQRIVSRGWHVLYDTGTLCCCTY